MSAESDARIFEALQGDLDALTDELNDAYGILAVLDARIDKLTEEAADAADSLAEAASLIAELEDTDELASYQGFTATTAIYPRTTVIEALSYLALGLASEVGEIAGKVKKVLRDNDGILTAEDQIALNDEVGDVVWYATRILDEMAYNLSGAMIANRQKLTSRAQRGVLGGSGDNR